MQDKGLCFVFAAPFLVPPCSCLSSRTHISHLVFLSLVQHSHLLILISCLRRFATQNAKSGAHRPASFLHYLVLYTERFVYRPEEAPDRAEEAHDAREHAVALDVIANAVLAVELRRTVGRRNGRDRRVGLVRLIFAGSGQDLRFDVLIGRPVNGERRGIDRFAVGVSGRLGRFARNGHVNIGGMRREGFAGHCRRRAVVTVPIKHGVFVVVIVSGRRDRRIDLVGAEQVEALSAGGIAQVSDVARGVARLDGLHQFYWKRLQKLRLFGGYFSFF